MNNDAKIEQIIVDFCYYEMANSTGDLPTFYCLLSYISRHDEETDY